MTLGKQQESFSKDMILLLVYATGLGFDVRFGEFFRPQLMQDHYFKTGRTKVEYSTHQDKLAGDLLFFKNGRWIKDKESLQPIGDFWESLNPLNKWGGNWISFVDTPHYERKRI